MISTLRLFIARHSAPCSEITLLLSRQMEEPLSLRERARASLHLLICKYCARFKAQLASMRILYRTRTKTENRLSPSARERIQSAIRARSQ